ncbi:Fe(3+) dicitrate transport ATP-binding protein FecE [Zhongshania aliphaticivorans]|uniref:Fe(3+) dicitrate transport ATP-binding protein FecE n=1 Tax=Zhongshania aliphaticivorans TaxID=1470434 RepID=A0A5S9QQM8_9GAMM|nr:ABC transporter ATP-binding protein [Zhongshania aliphaticivorans]CAA0109731.1 Fe(3+) dicitrate transport ATP-binding protein FecE [Zhongshania aliphaticivorans]CAA0117878.1 Fe(3+) dicitrate transport ATP-binding protein FecE [Zhongshania aliphaticivorans]CAA0121623.1 Fe(3+) dicitrate transport ATP-binding protein FecE [Zhongshania aliphaticivorans]
MLTTSDLIIDIPERSDGTPLSLQIKPGEIWGILGPNGAGKTTLLHTLAGLHKPRSGSVTLGEKNIHQMRRKQVAQQLAVVFQNNGEGFPATVLETVMIGRHPFISPWDIETADDLAIARQALQKLDLSALEHRLISTLSGGERQRLAIATALCQSPKLWLADEPSNHLDLKHQVQIMSLLADQADAGCGVVLCLHDLNLAAHWCNKIVLLYPNGDACWGDASAMLTITALERLYDQALTMITSEGQSYFMPLSSRTNPQ